MTEREFWRITPRKLIALVKCHHIANGMQKTEKTEEEKLQENAKALGALQGLIKG